MQKDEALPSDLLIEPLQLKHLSMLKADNNSKYLGVFQILLCKKWFSSLESSLTNLIPTRNSNQFFVEPVADVIIAIRPPTTAIVIERQKAPNRPTLGSTPAMPENAIASGIIANATTKPDKSSLLGLPSHSLVIP